MLADLITVPSYNPNINAVWQQQVDTRKPNRPSFIGNNCPRNERTSGVGGVQVPCTNRGIIIKRVISYPAVSIKKRQGMSHHFPLQSFNLVRNMLG